MVPYKISVKALNSAGCGQIKNVYCFTEEGGRVIVIIIIILFTYLTWTLLGWHA